ncbi:MAG: tyrosine-type recombinase/integrase [Desulfobacterales bacterium]|jgi:integrase/recombinase XerD|nr:tyrosine-type recombinase/integrase [Desulfobacterales bacterium]
MQESKRPEQKTKIEELTEQVGKHLIQLRYSKSSISHYRGVWRRFLEYSDEQYFSEELAMRYLKDCCSIPETRYPDKLPHKLRVEFRAIRVLYDYERFGQIFSRRMMSPKVKWPIKYRKVVDSFFEHCKKRSLSPGWMRRQKLVMKSFSQFLDREKIQSCEMINSVSITEFIATQVGYTSNTMSTNFSHLKAFLRYLYLNKHNKTDLTACLPRIKHVVRKQVPSIWTKEEAERLLAAVDKGNPCGKRDYAMLLLIVRLGLRISDVRSLQLSNLKWDLGSVEFNQIKTGHALSLPLLEDVGWAIIDYLKHGRPISDSQNVFIKHIAPFTAFSSNNNLHYLINKYLIRAKIEVPAEKSHGMHSLRHTLASELLQQHVSLPIIAEILGHRDINTTANYLRVDVSLLKQCALNVEVQHEEY